jgi:3',5'-cyclic-AMP phosphodiesterase
MTEIHNRREAIRLGLGMGVGSALGVGLLSPLAGCQTAQTTIRNGVAIQPARRRVVRLTHMTDTHIQPEKKAFEGVAACLRHMNDLQDRPDLVLTGGDLIMDSFNNKEARTRTQWDLWTKVFADHCPIPVEHCLGNHDIWGWDKKGSATTGDEPMWGKRWAMDLLRLDRPYKAFDLGGTGAGSWRCVILDSVQQHPANPQTYIGQIDPEQMAWLKAELKAAGSRPVLVVSHIPILSIGALAYDSEIKGHDWVLTGANMMIDGGELIKLFAATKNVKLCLSGHIHKLDRCDYEGTTYICDGAVSGAWWNGPKDRVVEGYGVIDLYNDGSFEHEYLPYGWQVG